VDAHAVLICLSSLYGYHRLPPSFPTRRSSDLFTLTTCDDELARDLAAVPRGRVRLQGEIGRIDARLADLPPLELGGHRLERVRCVVRDLHTTSSIRDPAEVRVAGVLGADLLRRFRVIVDPERATLTLLDPGEAAP